MKKKYILKKNLEFQNIINKKNQLINKYLILYYDKNDKFEIGISIPKKFANAVKRNYIKRQIKWIINNEIEYKNINYRIVLIIRKDYINLNDISFRKKQVVNLINKLKK